MRARCNPFRTECVERIRYRFVGDGSWDGLMDRLRRLDYRAAVVGPDGSGKTTLLGELAPRLEALKLRPRPLFLNTERRHLPPDFSGTVGADDVILLDGADLMGRLAWARFRRRTRAARGLVITSHRPGLLPTLIECRTTPELLGGIVAELLGEPSGAAPGLFDKHEGNLRDALRELYDVHAESQDRNRLALSIP